MKEGGGGNEIRKERQDNYIEEEKGERGRERTRKERGLNTQKLKQQRKSLFLSMQTGFQYVQLWIFTGS